METVSLSDVVPASGAGSIGLLRVFIGLLPRPRAMRKFKAEPGLADG